MVQPRRLGCAITTEHRPPPLKRFLELPIHRSDDSKIILNECADPRIRLRRRPFKPRVSLPRLLVFPIPDKVAGLPVTRREPARAAGVNASTRPSPSGLIRLPGLLFVLGAP
jgi:hypothetical protein